MRRYGQAAVWHGPLMLLLMAVACAPSARPNAPQASVAEGDGSQLASRPRGALTIALPWEPDQLAAKGTGGEAGADTRWMFNSPLTSSDPHGEVRPMLAQVIPGRESGD